MNVAGVETPRGTDGHAAAGYESWGASSGRDITLFTKSLLSADGEKLPVNDRSNE